MKVFIIEVSSQNGDEKDIEEWNKFFIVSALNSYTSNHLKKAYSVSLNHAEDEEDTIRITVHRKFHQDDIKISEEVYSHISQIMKKNNLTFEEVIRQGAI